MAMPISQLACHLTHPAQNNASITKSVNLAILKTLSKALDIKVTSELLKQRLQRGMINTVSLDVPPSITVSVRRLLVPLAPSSN